MKQEKHDAFSGLIKTIDKTEKEIVHLLLDYEEGVKKGKLSKEFLKHKREFYHEFLIRFDAMKELIRYPHTANLRLKRLREEKGLSQAKIAEKVGISRWWYIYLEGGESYKVSKKVKMQVCEVLETTYKEAFPIDHLLESIIKKGKN